ncbi:UrcA family protein [Sphingomicrobium flavum]|uniref:UrcA family protein n=1 Tax=Sphingomicrobium flavum TaxID=1229164 RepID=UPI0021AD8CF6|nr:UrcA family protein [Sphingomicrobium flavum]
MKTLFPLIGAAALMAAPAAAAQDDVTIIAEADLPSALIFHGDLDLTKAAGTKALKQRIVHAARQMCFSSTRQSLETIVEEKACYSAAKADGFQQLEDLQLASAAGHAVAASSSMTIRTR